MKEKIEEAAREAYKKHSVNDDRLSLDEQIQRAGGFIVGFTVGAKYQAERMYSEEDMKAAWENGMKSAIVLNASFEMWFEQFKKK
jgi:hypothetical protein